MTFFDSFGIKVKTKKCRSKIKIMWSSPAIFLPLIISFPLFGAGVFWLGGDIAVAFFATTGLMGLLIVGLMYDSDFAYKIFFLFAIPFIIFFPFFVLEPTRSNEEKRQRLIILKERHPKKWQAAAEYHVCEHKLIYLLEEGREVSLANLFSTPVHQFHCGEKGNQDLTLTEPSVEKLMETIKVGQEYLQKINKKTKQSP